MNKAELTETLAQTTSLTKADCERLLNATFDTIKKALKKGDDVTLVGFGTFVKAQRKAREGRNPQTGAKIKIPAANIPKFKPGKEFKEFIKS